MMYALGALEHCAEVCDVDEVCMVIHQPRLNHVSEHWLPVADLLAFKAEVERAAAETRQPDARLEPGEKPCRFCKAKHDCPALKAMVEETVDHIAPGVSADDFADLGDNSLSIAMGRVDLIEQWCRSVRAEVERRLVAGNDVPGYKLVEGRRGNRAWKSAEIAQAELAKFLKRDEMIEEKFISPATAEKLLKKNPDGLEALDSLTERPEGKLSVAPDTDKRPAKAPNATADDFADR
jgi:PP-loop superfamily ATP-utilizing enzyme